MKIEMVYSPENLENSPEMIEECDLLILEDLIETYGADAVFDALNEDGNWSHFGNDWAIPYNKTAGGTSKVKGLGKLIQSIPSFAITAAISWPVAVFAGIGALSHRIQKRWEDHNSWRQRLIPGFWVDALGAPQGTSTPHDIVAAPYRLSKKALKLLGIGAAGAVGYEAAKKKGIIDKIKGYINKKKDGKDAAKDASTDSSIAGATPYMSVPGEQEQLFTPEEVKSWDFKEYWVTLTNGEVIRVKTNTAENAKRMVAWLLGILAASKYYKTVNAEISSGRKMKYTVPFDNGEVAIVAAQSEKDAIETAISQRKQFCDSLNKSCNGLIPLEPMAAGNVVKQDVVVKTSEKVKEPQIKDVLDHKPEKKEQNVGKLPKPLYKLNGLDHYKVRYSQFIFNYGAGDKNSAIDVFNGILKNEAKDLMTTIENNFEKYAKIYIIGFGDGDVYKIPNDSEFSAKEQAEKLHKVKMSVMEAQSPRDGRVELANLLKKYGTKINAMTSRMQSTEKPRKLGKSDKAYFAEILDEKGSESKFDMKVS